MRGTEQEREIPCAVLSSEESESKEGTGEREEKKFNTVRRPLNEDTDRQKSFAGRQTPISEMYRGKGDSAWQTTELVRRKKIGCVVPQKVKGTRLSIMEEAKRRSAQEDCGDMGVRENLYEKKKIGSKGGENAKSFPLRGKARTVEDESKGRG